jgi:hypothetical protein
LWTSWQKQEAYTCGGLTGLGPLELVSVEWNRSITVQTDYLVLGSGSATHYLVLVMETKPEKKKPKKKRR